MVKSEDISELLRERTRIRSKRFNPVINYNCIPINTRGTLLHHASSLSYDAKNE